ncbi:MAG: hypothetical protein OXH52_04565 [Gammaproteobacteria bacterium]|nr:hypothetical protein [Gammaproteobacteria bacterium]
MPHARFRLVIVGIKGVVVSVKRGYNEDNEDMVVPIVEELNSLLRAQARARHREPSAGEVLPNR